jgi:hypothetical protein
MMITSSWNTFFAEAYPEKQGLQQALFKKIKEMFCHVT